jgi:hypothetical protein
MQDDDEDAPLCLGVGACHELVASRPKRRPQKSRPIGFVIFDGKPKQKADPITKKVRRAPKAR